MAEFGEFGRRATLRRHSGDPLALLVGLFDCSLVLALAFAVHIARATPAGGDAADRGVVVPDSTASLPRFRRADGEAAGDGTRLGVAYQLPGGEVVFVPEGAAKR